VVSVPLARRNLLANTPRLIRSVSGIAFAVLLMIVELGFRDGFLESMVMNLRALDGDIMLISSAKYQVDRIAPFSRRQLYEARAVAGVASASPLYIERLRPIWKNPQDQRLYRITAYGLDPDHPVFLFPDLAAKHEALRQPDTVMFDRRARSFLGEANAGTETELARRHITVVGTFELGPNFFSDGNVIMSDRNFFKFFGARGAVKDADLPDIEIGAVKVLPQFKVADVKASLRAALPPNVAVLTKAELVDEEKAYNVKVSPIGPIFNIGTIIGLAVGMMISYQILFSELSDQRSQYATLKAMGYRNHYLVKVVLQQAVFYALIGYGPAWILSFLALRAIGEIALLPLGITFALTLTTLAMTVVMCTVSALIAVRRVISADPAELFS
jgi:putative ABC transport system permease protein